MNGSLRPRSAGSGAGSVRLWLIVLGFLSALALGPLGCETGTGDSEGPGHRPQKLALTPQQELQLGQRAYQEVLSKPQVYGPALPADRPEVRRVRGIIRRIARAAEIEPLQREINLRVRGYGFEWEANVLGNKQINAFCLPGGKMAVFTGILPVAENDDQLATVLSHEMSHALAHHASERLARQQMFNRALEVIGGAMHGMGEGERREFLGVLAAGAGIQSKAYDRRQEAEADKIGLFLMAFAGYDPHEAVRFWGRMQEKTAGLARPPEILSDHPSDAHRIKNMQDWAPRALAAKRAFDEGRIAPPGR